MQKNLPVNHKREAILDTTYESVCILLCIWIYWPGFIWTIYFYLFYLKSGTELRLAKSYAIPFLLLPEIKWLDGPFNIFVQTGMAENEMDSLLNDCWAVEASSFEPDLPESAFEYHQETRTEVTMSKVCSYSIFNLFHNGIQEWVIRPCVF
jgi:hypothetical protein